MKAERFLEIINEAGIEYFCGVPDSQLSSFTDAVVNRYGFSVKNHVVAVNEGCAVGLAAGYHLATGKTPCVYMQNSGLGNAVNPITSLLNREVYGIGCLFVIGYRGQEGVHDEPQHVFMGKITLPLLELLSISYLIIDEATNEADFKREFNALSNRFKAGESVAIVVKKKSLTISEKPQFTNEHTLNRESVVETISRLSGEAVIVSTTGKISRELYEASIRQGMAKGREFLTVGSMGHCSSIAASIALESPNKRVVVIDGDGAVLMHMGALATLGTSKIKNLVHILLDNGSHETVGGMPTVAGKVDFSQVAKACGYAKTIEIDGKSSFSELEATLKEALGAQLEGSIFIRIGVAIGSRADLLRPKERAIDNKAAFMRYLSNE